MYAPSPPVPSPPCSAHTLLHNRTERTDSYARLPRRTDQNLAFRAVNQSIGRALRHASDWAAIVLLDARYLQPAKQRQLPEWLGKNVKDVEKFGGLVGGLAGFVKRRKTAASGV